MENEKQTPEWFYKAGHNQGQVYTVPEGKTVAVIHDGEAGPLIAAAPALAKALNALLYHAASSPRPDKGEPVETARALLMELGLYDMESAYVEKAGGRA